MADLEPEHLRKVFIGGLPPVTTDESMRDYFSKYGEILDCIVMKDSQTRRSRGFGFVAFDHSSCVDKLQDERPHVLDGKEIDTKRVVPKTGASNQPRSDREQKVNKVFIGGLRDEITDEDIRQFFAQFGVVERVETFMDKERNKRKGFAFVTFQDFDSVDKCVLQAQTMPDGKLNLQGYKVEVKKAKSQDEMRGGGGGGRGGGFGGGRGGGGRGGMRGGFNQRGGGGGYGDYGNQNFNQGGGYQGGYNNQGGYGGGGGYGNQGGNMGGGGGDGYSGGYNNDNWGGNQSNGWGGGGGGGGGGNYNNGGGFGGGYGNSSGGGAMRGGGYNKGNRSGPYGGGGGGGGGWRN